MLAIVTVSAIFLRWLPHHGFPILVLVAVTISAAATIYFTQRRRYRASSRRITREAAEADIPAVLWTALASLGLGLLGVAVVLAPWNNV